MCGITGYFGTRNGQKIVRKMVESLKHRGPDDNGIYQDGLLTLGHTRLSILDLSEKSKQPFVNEDKNLVIIFNGEIYNWPELKQDLSLSYTLKTNHSDTELVLLAYHKYGLEIFTKIKGMYAFCIYNKKENSLLLARDPIGEKPLYFSIQKDEFVFSSEINSIISTDIVSAKVNDVQLYHYFTTLSPMPGESLFKNIQKLKPGHFMKVSFSKDTSFKYYEQSFFNIAEHLNKKLDMNYSEIMIEGKKHLINSITSQSVSDTDVAIALSGGIDSSLNLLVAKKSFSVVKNENRQLFSINITFNEAPKEFDESILANKLSQENEVSIISINLTSDDYWKALDYLTSNIIDMPVVWPDMVLIHVITAKLKSLGIKVMLTGEGGDELGAYGSYFYGLKMFDDIEAGVCEIPKTYRYKNNLIPSRFCIGFHEIDKNAFWIKNIDVNSTYGELYNLMNEIKVKGREGFARKILNLEYKLRLPELILNRLDFTAMQNSVETRAPFLDIDLLTNILPSSFFERNKDDIPKAWLTEMSKTILPDYIYNASKKGFGQEFNIILNTHLISKFTDEIINNKQAPIRNYFSSKFFDLCLSRQRKRKNYGHRIWILYTVNKWLINIEKKSINIVTQNKTNKDSLMLKLIPVKCFLNRVFPTSFYKDDMNDIVNNKIFKPRKDCEDFMLTFPIDWEAISKKEDRNWRMQLQGWAMFHPIMNFFDESNEKEKIVGYFFEVANDWNNIYGEDAEDIVTSRMPKSFAWYDMSVGFRALVIAFFIDRINCFTINISDKNKNILNKLATKHINNLKLEKVFSLNNHGMFQIQGLMALIQVRDIHEYKSEKEYALTKMEELILSQYDKNGVHLEHSPLYHFYALTTFENLLLNDWYKDKPIIKKIVEKANAIKKWIVDPYARPACIGDSIMTVQKSVDFSNNDFSKELEVSTDDNKFVYSNFNDSGYSIFRSKWDEKPEDSTYLFLMGMYNKKTHKHRDCLSFEWFDNGKKIICDSGKYGYISDKYRHYFLSNKAHNTVEIEGFDILKIKPYGSSIKSTEYKEGIFYQNAVLDYPAIKFKRKLYLKANKWLIVCDDLDFVKARNITQWFHLEKNYKLVNLEKTHLTFKRGKEKLIIHCLDSELNTTLYCGDNDEMQGFISENDFIYEESLALGFSCHSNEKKIVTILALSDEAYFEALSFIINNNIYKLSLDNSNISLPTKSLIANIKHKSYLETDIVLESNKNTYSTFINDMRLDFYCDNKKSKELLIMLPGAVNRSKIIHNFQRFSWSDDFEYSVMSLLDPTIKNENNLSIGWFQGLSENYGIDNFILLLKNLFKVNNIKEENVTFFGSSAGGFSALKLANTFLSSKIIAINPQVYISNYHKNEFDKLLNYSYKFLSKKSVLEKYKDRLSIDIDFQNRKVPIWYYQNIVDSHHMKKHLQLYLKTLDSKVFSEFNVRDSIEKLNQLNIIYYEDPESGHSPPSKEKTIQIINQIIEGKK